MVNIYIAVFFVLSLFLTNKNKTNQIEILTNRSINIYSWKPFIIQDFEHEIFKL